MLSQHKGGLQMIDTQRTIIQHSCDAIYDRCGKWRKVKMRKFKTNKNIFVLSKLKVI